ncbi:MAG: hypothetical protein ABSE45_12165 [Candidatus Acidiferrales bacterium]|jgi:hypothetical protein
MTTDFPTARIACTLTNDPRLIVGASAIPAHVARQAGLSEKMQEDLASAAVEACRETFGLGRASRNSPSAAQLTAASFPDRVEVTIELSVAPRPRASKARAKPVAKNASKKDRKPLESALVDHVQRETRDGRPCIRLVKYGGAAKSRPKA